MALRRYWRWIVPVAVLLAVGVIIFVPARLVLLLQEALQEFEAGNFYLDPVVPRVMFGSFWALPGWLTLQLDRTWYQLLMAAVSLSMVGLGVLLIRRRQLVFSLTDRPRLQALVMLLLTVTAAVAIPLAWSAITEDTRSCALNRSLLWKIPYRRFVLDHLIGSRPNQEKSHGRQRKDIGSDRCRKKTKGRSY